jgi:(p)ppGpp synthase/HD superfamily hydrolase
MPTALSDVEKPLYSERVGNAMKLAADAFRFRIRKGSRVPYLTHLLGVTTIAMDHGADEDQIIGAVLHDLIEDINARDILCLLGVNGLENDGDGYVQQRLRSVLVLNFGERAVEIVFGLSDTTSPGTKEPYHTRKTKYLARLREEPEFIKLVAAADKLHNMRSLIRDYGAVGRDVFNRFGRTTIDDHHWYYEGVVAAISHEFHHPIVGELQNAWGTLSGILASQPEFTRSAL